MKGKQYKQILIFVNRTMTNLMQVSIEIVGINWVDIFGGKK